MNLDNYGIREIVGMLNDRSISAVELLGEYLDIALKGCCITFCNDLAFKSADKSDKRRKSGKERSPIDGLPFSLKDNICTKGIPTTCNSRSLKSNVPDYNAFVVENLYDAGTVLTAKNCMREFSVGKIEDSAFEIRNYVNWAGTNNDINIGAFSVGTDIGMCDFYCGLWTFRPYSNHRKLSEGIITGSSTLEKVTLSARKADDLRFILPYVLGEPDNKKHEEKINPKLYKILVYDNVNMPEYIVNFLESCGFCVECSSIPFLDEAEMVYDSILCSEFFTELHEIGRPENEIDYAPYFEDMYIKNRIEGFGFEVKKLIVTGAYYLCKKHKKNTVKIIRAGNSTASKLYNLLDQYDFIAAPAIYEDKLSKASAISLLPELTVPLGDVLSFKLYAAHENENLLLNMAEYLEERV